MTTSTTATRADADAALDLIADGLAGRDEQDQSDAWRLVTSHLHMLGQAVRLSIPTQRHGGTR